MNDENNFRVDATNEFASEHEFSKEPDSASVIKIAQTIQKIKNRLASCDLKCNRDRVAYILNYFPQTRNSDKELCWEYWKTFHPELFNGLAITKDALFRMPGATSLVRIRAKIQNEYNLFIPNASVRKKRHLLAEEISQEAVEDKPTGLPMYVVYIDESGKNDKYLIVGSLWVIDGGSSTLQISNEMALWKKVLGINYEFHFAEINSKQKLEVCKQFFIKFLSLAPTVGFKLITLQNKGHRDINSPLTDLMFHLLNKGIDHENTSGRAPLPRLLMVNLDSEDLGSDHIKLENIKSRLKGQNIKDLYLGHFNSIDSKNSVFIQAVDLFTSSVNRLINFKDQNKNYKSEFAEFLISTLNLDLSEAEKESLSADSAKVFHLSFNTQKSNETE